MIENGKVLEWFPHFDHGFDGKPLSDLDDDKFTLELVLEDSDHVLYANHDIGKAFVYLVRSTRRTGGKVPGEEFSNLNTACEKTHGREGSRSR